MINHPQTMDRCAGSLVQFVGTPEVFMKTLGEFFVHAETREKNSKTSKNCCLGVNCRVFFSTKLLGDIEKHSIISIVAICCLRLLFQKVNISTKRTMEFFSFIFGRSSSLLLSHPFKTVIVLFCESHHLLFEGF